MTVSPLHRALLRLWFEPWIGAHADGLDVAGPGREAAPSVPAAWSGPAARLRYRAWCRRRGLAPSAPGWLCHGASALPDLALLPAGRIDGATAFLAAVARAGEAGFRTAWLRDGAAWARLDRPERWRDALRLAGIRPLRIGAAPASCAATRLSLVSLGAGCLAAALEPRWPGLWARLSVRFERAVRDEVRGNSALDAAIQAAIEATPFSEADVRHVLRVWRLGAQRGE